MRKEVVSWLGRSLVGGLTKGEGQEREVEQARYNPQKELSKESVHSWERYRIHKAGRDRSRQGVPKKKDNRAIGVAFFHRVLISHVSHESPVVLLSPLHPIHTFSF